MLCVVQGAACNDRVAGSLPGKTLSLLSLLTQGPAPESCSTVGRGLPTVLWGGSGPGLCHGRGAQAPAGGSHSGPHPSLSETVPCSCLGQGSLLP